MVSAGYEVSWEVFGRNDSRLTLTLNSTTHEFKIKGLSSLTTYTIDVAAVTAVGVGLATSSTISSGVPPGQCPRPRAAPCRASPGRSCHWEWMGVWGQESLGPLGGVVGQCQWHSVSRTLLPGVVAGPVLKDTARERGLDSELHTGDPSEEDAGFG